jgi:hypothetical protein
MVRLYERLKVMTDLIAKEQQPASMIICYENCEGIHLSRGQASDVVNQSNITAKYYCRRFVITFQDWVKTLIIGATS